MMTLIEDSCGVKPGVTYDHNRGKSSTSATGSPVRTGVNIRIGHHRKVHLITANSSTGGCTSQGGNCFRKGLLILIEPWQKSDCVP